MVRQEVWAFLSACQLIHAARADAAEAAPEDLDPDRISYTVTLRAVRRQIPPARTRTTAAPSSVKSSASSCRAGASATTPG